MCLTVRKFKKDNSHIKTAKQTIVVYKRLYKPDRLKDQPEKYLAPYRKTIWLFNNKVQRVAGFGKDADITINIHKAWDNKTHLTKGLHAYTSIKKAKDWCGDFNVIFKAYIPKGAKYILGKNGHIISTHMILKEIIHRGESV